MNDEVSFRAEAERQIRRENRKRKFKETATKVGNVLQRGANATGRFAQKEFVKGREYARAKAPVVKAKVRSRFLELREKARKRREAEKKNPRRNDNMFGGMGGFGSNSNSNFGSFGMNTNTSRKSKGKKKSLSFSDSSSW